MGQSTEENFIQDIINTLQESGYPQKKVSLPLERMYETADKLDVNFNKVLERLKNEKGINHLSTIDKIIFSPYKPNPLENLDKDEMIDKAREFVNNLSPDKVEEIKSTYQKMSADQREEILRRGREMGLV